MIQSRGDTAIPTPKKIRTSNRTKNSNSMISSFPPLGGSADRHQFLQEVDHLLVPEGPRTNTVGRP